jgi:hypothetical protein
MILERCSDQKSKSLDAFYAEMAAGRDSVSHEGGLAMLDMLAALRSRADRRCVWGLTSHYRLCLLSKDAYTSPWYVIVSALDRRNYFIEYLMPEGSAPWAGAYVKGEGRSLEVALSMVVIAMDRSGGWPSTP